MKNLKILLLHGRKANEVHLYYADLIGAKKLPVDFVLNWQAEAKPFKFKVYLSWLLCTILLAFKKYDILVVESFREPAIFLKLLNLVKRKKVILLLTNETAYLLANAQLSSTTTKLYNSFLKKVDGIICVGQMVKQIASEIHGGSNPNIEAIFNGIAMDRYETLMNGTNDLSSKRILIIAHGSGQGRIHCKGLDIMIDAFEVIYASEPEATLTIIGDWDDKSKSVVFESLPLPVQKNIHFIGYASDIHPYLAKSQIYLHIARGESWGISILEAMRAGVIPIVSEWTGAKEVVSKVDPKLVVPLSKAAIAERVLEIFDYSLPEKLILSSRCREVTTGYTQEAAGRSFMAAFQKIMKRS